MPINAPTDNQNALTGVLFKALESCPEISENQISGREVLGALATVMSLIADEYEQSSYFVEFGDDADPLRGSFVVVLPKSGLQPQTIAELRETLGHIGNVESLERALERPEGL